jgi:hypothetical protein
MKTILTFVVCGVLVFWVVPQFAILDSICRVLGLVLIGRACWIVYARPLVDDIRKEWREM